MQSYGDTRSTLRMMLTEERPLLENIFVDKYGEPSFKKCVNIMELGKLLADKGVQLTKEQQEVIGPIMICFGDI